MLIGAEDLVRVEAARSAVVTAPFTFCRQSVVIDVAGLSCAVHFDDAAVGECFASRYADLVTLEAPQRHAFAMTDPELGHLFWSLGGTVFSWPRIGLDDDVVAFLADAVALTSFFQERKDGIISLHAATLGSADGVAAIIGDSHAGKTTTAVACARAGMQLYSDERCLIDPARRVHPFRRSINLRGAGLRLLSADKLAGDDPIGVALRGRSGDWDDVRLSTFAPVDGALQPAPLRAVFLLAGTATEASLEPATAANAARASARWAHGAGAGIAKVSRLLEIFAPVPCFRLYLGSPASTARLIQSVLKKLTPQYEFSA